jgi:hypothetical protein
VSFVDGVSDGAPTLDLQAMLGFSQRDGSEPSIHGRYSVSAIIVFLMDNH